MSIRWLVCPSIMLVLKTRIYDSAVVILGLCVGVEVGVWLGLCLINKYYLKNRNLHNFEQSSYMDL